jgi:hypothetical protein
MEVWSLHAAVNVKQAFPLLQMPFENISVKKMARVIQRRYKNPAKWNCVVNERCEPAIRSLLVLP